MVRKFFLLCGMMAIMIAMVSCGAAKPQKVKIVLSYGAPDKMFDNVLTAIKLALTESNGKAGQVEVELVTFNPYDKVANSVTAETETEVAQKAVADPAVVFYLGPSSSVTAKISMPILNKASIAQIGLANSWPGLTKPGYGVGEPGIYYPTGKRHFFRVNVSDDLQGVSAAQWVKQLGFKRICLVNDGRVYGQGLAGIFGVTAQDIGLEVVANEGYDAFNVTAAQLDELAARVVQTKPDLIYMGMTMDEREINLINKIRTLSPKIPIMGGDTFMTSELTSKVAPELINGIYATDVSVSAYQLESAKPFIESYRKSYGQEPNGWLVIYYEATKVALHAIEQAKEPTRAGVLEAMQNFGEYSGALGKWHFNKEGDFSLNLVGGYQIKDGKWEFVKVVQ